MGYFAGMRAALYRETHDGRKVYARRSILPWRKRWYYVTPAQESVFEKKVVQLHVVSLGLMIALIAIVGGDRFLTDSKWLLAVLLLAVAPSLQSWTTSSLEPAPIDETALKPLDKRAMSTDIARGFGAPTLWFLLAASVLMAAGQVLVIVTDGAWWAWLGAGMFTATAISTARQIMLLRSSNRSMNAS